MTATGAAEPPLGRQSCSYSDDSSDSTAPSSSSRRHAERRLARLIQHANTTSLLQGLQQKVRDLEAKLSALGVLGDGSSPSFVSCSEEVHVGTLTASPLAARIHDDFVAFCIADNASDFGCQADTDHADMVAVETQTAATLSNMQLIAAEGFKVCSSTVSVAAVQCEDNVAQDSYLGRSTIGSGCALHVHVMQDIAYELQQYHVEDPSTYLL